MTPGTCSQSSISSARLVDGQVGVSRRRSVLNHFFFRLSQKARNKATKEGRGTKQQSLGPVKVEKLPRLISLTVNRRLGCSEKASEGQKDRKKRNFELKATGFFTIRSFDSDDGFRILLNLCLSVNRQLDQKVAQFFQKVAQKVAQGIETFEKHYWRLAPKCIAKVTT